MKLPLTVEMGDGGIHKRKAPRKDWREYEVEASKDVTERCCRNIRDYWQRRGFVVQADARRLGIDERHESFRGLNQFVVRSTLEGAPGGMPTTRRW